ncbi:MAG: hypothetical protein ACREA4_00035 [Nitrososphaera sp.]
MTKLEEEPKIEGPKKTNGAVIKSERSVSAPPINPNAHSTPEMAVPVRVSPPVPPSVPHPVRGTVPLIPKVKRAIRQRQPFDIYEDQYKRLKKIAESERGFVNGRGMSQMVREAIDNYLKNNNSSKA